VQGFCDEKYPSFDQFDTIHKPMHELIGRIDQTNPTYK
jgi:hypothetical protein